MLLYDLDHKTSGQAQSTFTLSNKIVYHEKVFFENVHIRIAPIDHPR